MDLQSFLESGLIEAYVLGQCTAAERAEVERMAAAHPEVRTEIAATEQTLEQYARANAVQPPAWMKGRILDLIGRETTPARPPGGGLQRFLNWGLLAASLLLAFGLWRLYDQNQALQSGLSDLRRQTADCDSARQEVLVLQQRVAFLSDTSTRAIALKDSTHTAIAFLNEQNCEIRIQLASLPAPRDGSYFQFWAIVNGQPQSMGMLSRDAAAEWQSFRCAPGAVAYAISEEKNPNGNPTPTVVRLVGPTG